MMKTRSLKILLISKTLPWQFKGGIQTHVWELAQSLITKGHEVSILHSGPYRSKVVATNKEGIELISLPYFPGRYLKPISILAEEFSFNWAALRWVKEHHEAFDIIHTQGRSGYLLGFYAQVRNRLINTVHGLIDIESKNSRWYHFNHKIHQSLTKKIERKLYTHSKQLITVSEALKKDMVQRTLNPHIEVISNGVRKPIESPRFKTSNGRFLFVGRLHPIKGIKKIVEVMDQANDNVFLDIIGNGHDKKEIEKIIKGKGLENKVRLLGEMENEKVQEVLPFYNGLILPSQYETQGIVLLEANSHAIPVIASDLPAIRESVDNGFNGVLCPEGDSLAFIEAMNWLTEDRETAQMMGIKGRIRVEAQFTWDKIAEKTEALYYQTAQ